MMMMMMMSVVRYETLSTPGGHARRRSNNFLCALTSLPSEGKTNKWRRIGTDGGGLVGGNNRLLGRTGRMD